MASTCVVTRPIAVSPTKTAPSRRKCSCHVSRPGMEKPGHLLGHGIASRDIWSFVAVAVVTRKRQIAEVIGSAVFPSCDVIHLERKPGGVYRLC